MLNLALVTAVLSAFLWYQILLSVALLPGGRASMNRACLFYERRAIRLIFSMFACYRGFRPTATWATDVPVPERYLLVANHQSLLDIAVLMECMPGGRTARFVAKMELGRGIPLVSLILRAGGHCLVRRKGSPVDAMKAVSAFARRCAREGTCPVVFPEGTRTRTGRLGVFHSAGVRRILEEDRLPIVVAAVTGGLRVATLRNFFSGFGREPYSATFLAVLPAPDGKAGVRDALALARERIETYLAGH